MVSSPCLATRMAGSGLRFSTRPEVNDFIRVVLGKQQLQLEKLILFITSCMERTPFNELANRGEDLLGMGERPLRGGFSR